MPLDCAPQSFKMAPMKNSSPKVKERWRHALIAIVVGLIVGGVTGGAGLLLIPVIYASYRMNSHIG